MSFGSKIGFITNCSTYWWSLLANYDKGSYQYKELIYRLKLMRQRQGAEIDRTKGLEGSDMPKEYITYIKDMEVLEKELVASKKPYFQKYIYPKLNYEYKNFCKFREYHSILKYNLNWEENKNEEFLNYMNYKNPILDNNSVMNKICHYLENEIKEIKENSKKQNLDILNSILIDNDRNISLENQSFIDGLIIQYKQFRERERNICKHSAEEDFNQQIRFKDISTMIRKKVYERINNSIDVANIVVYCGYAKKSEINKDFVWNIFGKEVFNNVKKNSNEKILIPIKCNENEKDFIYLNEYYKIKEVIEKDDNI